VARGAQGGSYLILHQARRFRGIAAIKEHRKVEKQQGTIVELKTALAQQQNEIRDLTTSLKEQGAQIQKVSAQLEVSKPALQMTLNNQ